jgi:hypothetical protein
MGIAAYFFFLFLTLIVTSTTLGHGLRRLAWGRPLGFGYAQVLYSGLTGAVALATVGALWWTRGVTIHLLAVVVGLFMWHEARREKAQPTGELKPENTPNRWWNYWPLLAGAGLVYAFCAWGFVRPGAYVPFSIPNADATANYDHLYSSRIAYFSMVSGQESDTHTLNLLDPAYQGTKPYHYLELWLTNVISIVFGEKQVLVLYLVAYPFFFWLSLVGILALWQNSRLKVGLLAFLIATGLLFISGFVFEFYKSIRFLSTIGNFRYSILGGFLPKLGIVHAWCFAALLLAQHRQWRLALLTLLGLGLASSVVFPGLALACTLAPLCALVFRIGPRGEAIRAFSYALLLSLGVAAFYFGFDTATVGRDGASARGLSDLLAGLLEPSSLRTRFNIVVGTQVQLAIIYAPFGLVVAVFWPQWRLVLGRHRWLAWLVALLCLTIALAWAIFFKQLNASQLVYNLIAPLGNALLAALAVWVAAQAVSWRTWAAVAIFTSSAALSAYQGIPNYPLKNSPVYYSDQYLKRIDQYLARQTSPWLAGAGLKSVGEFYDIYSKHLTIYTVGSYLPYLGNGGAVAVSLNDLEVPIDNGDPLTEAREQQAVGMGLFYRWVAREKAAGTFRDVPTSQLAFVRHYGLKFLIISKGVEVPATLKPLVMEEFADELSGERFLVLNPKK